MIKYLCEILKSRVCYDTKSAYLVNMSTINIISQLIFRFTLNTNCRELTLIKIDDIMTLLSLSMEDLPRKISFDTNNACDTLL